MGRPTCLHRIWTRAQGFTIVVLTHSISQTARSHMSAYFPPSSEEKLIPKVCIELRKRARPRGQEQERRKNRGTDARRDEMVPSPDREHNRALSVRTWEQRRLLGGSMSTARSHQSLDAGLDSLITIDTRAEQERNKTNCSLDQLRLKV